MFGALKRGFRSVASLILVRNVVGELLPKRTLAASRGFLAAARLSCFYLLPPFRIDNTFRCLIKPCSQNGGKWGYLPIALGHSIELLAQNGLSVRDFSSYQQGGTWGGVEGWAPSHITLIVSAPGIFLPQGGRQSPVGGSNDEVYSPLWQYGQYSDIQTSKQTDRQIQIQSDRYNENEHKKED